MKNTIIKILKDNVKRNGIENMLQYMEDADYFTAPASTVHHGAHKGGLAEHSLQVYMALKEKNKKYAMGFSEETMAIVGLLHDICKVDYYVEDDEEASVKQMNYLSVLAKKPVNTTTKKHASALIEHFKGGGTEENMPEKEVGYKIEDKLPLGHGEKSIFIINKFMVLTDEEAMAIRWHMGPFELGGNQRTGTIYNRATTEFPIIVALFCADYETSKILNI